MRQHRYEVAVSWAGNRGSGTSGYRDYGREHQVMAEDADATSRSSSPGE